MATIQINRSQIDYVVKTTVQALQHNTALHPMEAIIGLAETLGRTIAVQEGTFVVHKEMLRVAMEHVETTVKAAYSAGGKDPRAFNG